MAAREVIYLPLRAQLSARLWSTTLLPLKPVAESPPQSEENLKHVPGESRLGVLVIQSRRDADEAENP